MHIKNTVQGIVLILGITVIVVLVVLVCVPGYFIDRAHVRVQQPKR
jgi:hypothetical protein